jgi:hypothetical protein
MKTHSSMLKFFLLTSAVVLALAFACQGIDTPQDPSGLLEATDQSEAQLATDHSHDMDVHWIDYDTVDEALANSTLVVRAKVTGTRYLFQRVYGWNEAEQRYYTPEEAGDEYTDFALTASTLSVAEVVRADPNSIAPNGGQVTAGGTIEIIELGGRSPDGHLMQPADKPVLRRGEEAVFFLMPSNKPGAYHVVGGWQGRFRVAGNAIRALATDVHPGLGDFSRADGRDVASFIAELRAK